MNKAMQDILALMINNKEDLSQRDIADRLNVSLGLVNKSINNLIKENYLDETLQLTQKSRDKIKQSKPKNAIILAAGYGMRMVPINTLISKGLLYVRGEVLIERTIKQLHDVGIKDIKIIVGFMKEKYEYLIDKYDVELIVNTEYVEKNNLYSLSLASDFIDNTYIIPCDIYCKKNLFHEVELYSWYMLSNRKDENSPIRINKKFELVRNDNNIGNEMVGIAYISEDISKTIQSQLKEFSKLAKYNYSFWEEIFLQEKKIQLKPYVVDTNDFIEINTYEDLRNIDNNSKSLNNEAIDIIKEVFNVQDNDIINIETLKKGMTNKSFLFECNSQKYIMRIPGEGTDKLINRKEEAEVYEIIKDKHVSDDIYYINPNNGYKITKFLNNARTCDPYNQQDLKKCIKKLKEFHDMNLKVKHEFNIFKQIEFYESLWNGNKSVFDDYNKTKEDVFSLKPFIEANIQNKCLTHIDAVPDNFLIHDEQIKLIDWEYAGMQDPHVDIAMFCIYALYDKKEIDNLINIYFENKCPNKIRIKIYAYISACGLLWSNWCEFKRNLGIEFGEYALRQYRYAKDYYKEVMKELEGCHTNE